MKRIRLSDGTTMDYPDAEDVQRFLGALGPQLDFAVLTDTHRGFVQVMWGPSMDEAEGTLVLETKGPHVQGHVQACGLSWDDAPEGRLEPGTSCAPGAREAPRTRRTARSAAGLRHGG